MDKITTSRYTFFVNSNDKFYLYNSLSNALIEVDNELYVLLEKLKKNHSFYTPSTDTESLFIDLKKDYFVTYNDEDDFLIYLKSASNLNGNLNCSKELEHYASW